VSGCQQGFLSVAKFITGGQESAPKPPQAICKPYAQLEKNENSNYHIDNIL
jgi:hypothetical protein